MRVRWSGWHGFSTGTPFLTERSQDQQDVRGIINRIGARLDRRYLDPIVCGLAGDLERPEIWERYQDYWRENDN
ncbi:hypothetical protein ACP3TJ_05000 [Desulforudis sp. 1088]|uniref:hypothetical protein n=1 Tax=unclassified Candidatus Desulforudis TaxID=2635950 RepID=UPI003499E4CE